MIEVGIISEVRDKKVRVAIGEMVTDFLNVIQVANSFCIHWKPLRVGEQCLVLPIRGDLNSGVVLRGVAYNSFDFSHTKENEELIVFEDGTQISYDSSSSKLKVLNPKLIELEVLNSVKLSSPTVDIVAETFNVNSTNINLIGKTKIQGAISTSGSNGSSGVFSINGSLAVSQNISTSGSISDARGDLTNHTNNGYSRD